LSFDYRLENRDESWSVYLLLDCKKVFVPAGNISGMRRSKRRRNIGGISRRSTDASTLRPGVFRSATEYRLFYFTDSGWS